MDGKEKPKRSCSKADKKKKQRNRWIFIAFALSFVVTAVISYLSGEIIEDANIITSILVLLVFIFINVLFDTIGLAVATADISKFNSMASRKLKTGTKAVWLVNNSERVSSFCNDLVGDIAGVVSGAAGATIAVRLFSQTEIEMWLTLALTSLIAAFTVGFKAIGKSIAINHGDILVTAVAKIMCGFKK